MESNHYIHHIDVNTSLPNIYDFFFFFNWVYLFGSITNIYECVHKCKDVFYQRKWVFKDFLQELSMKNYVLKPYCDLKFVNCKHHLDDIIKDLY